MTSEAQESISRWTRITEQVIINIFSAIGTAVGLAILAGILSGLGWLAQQAFHFVVIPTNLLVALFFVGVGMLIVLLIIAGILALLHRRFGRWLEKHPGVAVALSLGFIGVLLALSFEDKNTRDQFWEKLKKAEVGAKTQAAQQPPPAPAGEATK